MAKQVKQFRYYGKTSNKNSPELRPTTDTDGNLVNNNLSLLLHPSSKPNILEKYAPVLLLGIQSLPGTEFYLNDTGDTNDFPIIVGSTGIYEINVEGFTEIKTLRFAKESLKAIDDNELSYLIIDIIYDDGM